MTIYLNPDEAPEALKPLLDSEIVYYVNSSRATIREVSVLSVMVSGIAPSSAIYVKILDKGNIPVAWQLVKFPFNEHSKLYASHDEAIEHLVLMKIGAYK